MRFPFKYIFNREIDFHISLDFESLTVAASNFSKAWLACSFQLMIDTSQIIFGITKQLFEENFVVWLKFLVEL